MRLIMIYHLIKPYIKFECLVTHSNKYLQNNHKIENISGSRLRIFLRPSPDRDNRLRFEILKGRGPKNLQPEIEWDQGRACWCSRSIFVHWIDEFRVNLKGWIAWVKSTKISDCLHENWSKSNFFGPAGGSAPGKALRHQFPTWLVEP